MAEYIERQEAIKAVAEQRLGFHNAGEKPFFVMLDEAIESLCCVPAADVAPVVHAHWNMDGTSHHVSTNISFAAEMKNVTGKGYYVNEHLKCSHCRMVTMVDESIKYDFCPHCGAKMDEEA